MICGMCNEVPGPRQPAPKIVINNASLQIHAFESSLCLVGSKWCVTRGEYSCNGHGLWTRLTVLFACVVSLTPEPQYLPTIWWILCLGPVLDKAKYTLQRNIISSYITADWSNIE